MDYFDFFSKLNSSNKLETRVMAKKEDVLQYFLDYCNGNMDRCKDIFNERSIERMKKNQIPFDLPEGWIRIMSPFSIRDIISILYYTSGCVLCVLKSTKEAIGNYNNNVRILKPTHKVEECLLELLFAQDVCYNMMKESDTSIPMSSLNTRRLWELGLYEERATEIFDKLCDLTLMSPFSRDKDKYFPTINVIRTALLFFPDERYEMQHIYSSIFTLPYTLDNKAYIEKEESLSQGERYLGELCDDNNNGSSWLNNLTERKMCIICSLYGSPMFIGLTNEKIVYIDGCPCHVSVIPNDIVVLSNQHKNPNEREQVLGIDNDGFDEDGKYKDIIERMNEKVYISNVVYTEKSVLIPKHFKRISRVISAISHIETFGCSSTERDIVIRWIETEKILEHEQQTSFVRNPPPWNDLNYYHNNEIESAFPDHHPLLSEKGKRPIHRPGRQSCTPFDSLRFSCDPLCLLRGYAFMDQFYVDGSNIPSRWNEKERFGIAFAYALMSQTVSNSSTPICLEKNYNGNRPLLESFQWAFTFNGILFYRRIKDEDQEEEETNDDNNRRDDANKNETNKKPQTVNRYVSKTGMRAALYYEENDSRYDDVNSNNKKENNFERLFETSIKNRKETIELNAMLRDEEIEIEENDKYNEKKREEKAIKLKVSKMLKKSRFSKPLPPTLEDRKQITMALASKYNPYILRKYDGIGQFALETCYEELKKEYQNHNVLFTDNDYYNEDGPIGILSQVLKRFDKTYEMVFSSEKIEKLPLQPLESLPNLNNMIDFILFYIYFLKTNGGTTNNGDNEDDDNLCGNSDVEMDNDSIEEYEIQNDLEKKKKKTMREEKKECTLTFDTPQYRKITLTTVESLLPLRYDRHHQQQNPNSTTDSFTTRDSNINTNSFIKVPWLSNPLWLQVAIYIISREYDIKTICRTFTNIPRSLDDICFLRAYSGMKKNEQLVIIGSVGINGWFIYDLYKCILVFDRVDYIAKEVEIYKIVRDDYSTTLNKKEYESEESIKARFKQSKQTIKYHLESITHEKFDMLLSKAVCFVINDDFN